MSHIKTTLFVLFSIFTVLTNLYAAGHGAGKGNVSGQQQGVHAHQQSQGQGDIIRNREHAEGGNCASNDSSACTQSRDRKREQIQTQTNQAKDDQ